MSGLELTIIYKNDKFIDCYFICDKYPNINFRARYMIASKIWLSENINVLVPIPRDNCICDRLIEDLERCRIKLEKGITC